MITSNEDCTRDIMLYVQANLKMKPNGSYFKIPVRHILLGLGQYTYEEKLLSVRLLLENQLLTRTNPENIVSPKAASINGITPKGFKYIDTVKQQDFWSSYKKHLSLDNILNLINTGISVAQIISKISQCL